MNDFERTVLTWACLVMISWGTFRFIQAERLADRIYVKAGGAQRTIRQRIIRGKRFVVGMGICLFAIIQNLFLQDVWSYWEIRGIAFAAACILYALAAEDIHAGYDGWDRDMRLWLDDDEEPEP